MENKRFSAYLIFNMITVKINKEICKGCELCITVCENKLIFMTDDFNSKGLHYAVFSNKEKKCTGCKLCTVICPDAAIEIDKERDLHAKS